MDPIEDILESTQRDVTERLKATPGLVGVKVIIEDEKTLESHIADYLGRLNGGICIVVLRPEIVDVEKNQPGPTFKVRQEIQVIECVSVNAGKSSNPRCGSAAIRVLRTLHLATLGNTTLYGDKDAVKPQAAEDGYAIYLVSVTGFPPSVTIDKPASVGVEMDGTSVVLSCATLDASIYFSTDGSYPAMGSGNSQLYTAPIESPPIGTRFRAAAYAPDMNPGDVLNFDLNSET